MKYRQERLNSLIREELSKIIARDMEFDGALVTLTKADIRDDFSNVKIGVSALPSSKVEAALEKLISNAGNLKHSLLKKMKIRSVPDLVFEIDHGPEKAAQIEKILLNDNIER